MNTTEFDEIRPYNDEELSGVFEELIADPAFQKVVAGVIPDVPFEILAQKMRACRTKLEFQKTFCYGLLWKLAGDCTDGISLDHTAIPDKSKAYTYISNHRDIILDSGFLSVLLVDQGMDTVEIAIGDNLLIYPWIKKFVRVNKSFIVQRALTMRQMLESSARMSRYMHYTIGEKNQSIWIAQREGRAKDSNDRTQDSVLKMLAMGGEGDVVSRLMEMNIAPLAISYEYDPCDYLKAQEFQLKRDIEGYKKTMADDLKRMEWTPGNYYNFHPGSHVGQGAEAGVRMIAEMLNEVLTEDQTTTVLLETMSGKGTEMGRNFEELRQILDLVEKKEKMGICLDTCHVWDGGYDIVNDFDGVLEEFDRIIGLEKLKAIHLNDSLNDLGSHKDRHARIGEGRIGLEALVRVIRYPRLEGIPFILETPNDDEGWAAEIRTLREAYEK